MSTQAIQFGHVEKIDETTEMVVLPDGSTHVQTIGSAGYIQQRRISYPSFGDQLDALWKQYGPTLAPGSEAESVYQQILAVKQKYPKPTE